MAIHADGLFYGAHNTARLIQAFLVFTFRIAIRDDTTVFVEVKLRTSRRMGAAVQQISAAKGARLRTLADAYWAEHSELPENLRIDLIAIELTVGGDVGQLNHVENAIDG